MNAAGAARGDGLVKTLGFASAIQIIATAAALALTAIVPLVVAATGASANFVGYQISLVYVTGTLAAAASGRFIQRFGAVGVEQLCLATFALGLLCFATARLEIIALGSLVIGVGYGLQNPAASQLLAGVVTPATRNLVYSVKQAGVPLGGVLASIGVPALSAWFGWRATLAASALIPVACMIGLRVAGGGKEQAATVRRSGFLAGQQLLLRNRQLATLAFVGFFYSAVQLSLSAFAVTTLVEDAAWPLVTAGGVAAVMQLAGAAGRIGWGMVADRTGAGMMVLAALGFAGALGSVALFLAIDGPAWLQVVMLALLGCIWLGWNGVMLAEAAQHAPADRVGQATGAVLVYVFTGVIVGPASFGLVAHRVDGYALTFALYSVVAILGAAAALVMARRGARTPTPG